MKKLEEYGDVLTVKELIEFLPIGRNNIYKLLSDGIIRNLKVGKKIIVPKQ